MTKVNRQDLRGFRRRRSKTGNRKFHKSSNAISKALSKYMYCLLQEANCQLQFDNKNHTLSGVHLP